MEAFTYYCPTRILFGAGREAEVGTQVRACGGTKVLVLYGGHSAVKSGLLDRVTASLQAEGLSFVLLGGVQPNPLLSLARQGVALALREKCDFCLAVGGGSVIDTAKAVALGAANPDLDIWDDIWMRKPPLKRVLPVGVVLTISAAGSETSDSAVLTNDETRQKRGLNTDLQRPLFAIMNPELTYTLPAYQISCGAADILMHTLERYFTPESGNDMTDEIAEGLMRNVIRAGSAAHRDSHDYHAMSELMWSGSLSHNNLTNLGRSKDFSVHQLGHELSAMFDATHGATLATMWPSWARYCLAVDPARFARLGEKVWGLTPTGDAAADGFRAIDACESFFRSLDLPTSLSQLLGHTLDEATLAELADRCTFRGGRKVGCFRPLDGADLLAIYRMANH